MPRTNVVATGTVTAHRTGALLGQAGPATGISFSDSGKADLSTPEARFHAANNVLNVYDRTPEHQKKEGQVWYDKVNEATAKGIKGTSLNIDQGAGLVAAVSPSMDWEKGNIDAFGEMKKLKTSDWDAIRTSHAKGLAQKEVNKTLPKEQRVKPGRTPEAAAVLAGKSISKAPDANLVKAHRIISGEPVGTVIDRRTAPKTDAFRENIARPDVAGKVTIDGRAADIAGNRMTGWTKDRGISSASTKSGKPTRYEHFESAYKDAAGAAGELPHTMQAVTWVGGKHVEMSTPTKSGKPRQKGPTRVGQPYV